MNHFFKTINTLTAVDIELPMLSEDIEALEALLKALKEDSTTQPFAYCYIHTIILASKTDLLTMSNLINQCLRNDSATDLQMDLQENLDTINNLLVRCDTLSENFQPYLYCPALEMKD